MEKSRLYSIKMRASRDGAHISGAERIVPSSGIPAVAAALAGRALGHSKGVPDFINIKIESAGGIIRLDALPVSSRSAGSPDEGRRAAAEILESAGIARAAEIMSMLPLSYGMRGAILLDADTLERLEPDQERGVRATYMDSSRSSARNVPLEKNHFAEALVLATKVLNAPNIAGEICVSDDPDYTTGYVATGRTGYCRIAPMKPRGDCRGGRIFLYRGPRSDVGRTIAFLERQAVLVDGIPPSPRGCARSRTRFDSLASELREMESEGLRRSIPRPAARGSLVLSSNDYLGLADGHGSTGSRLTTGTHEAHLSLERRIAEFKGTEAAIVFSSGYMANTGAITSLVGKGDAVFSDSLNHASIIDGCRLSGADIFVYRHLDMDDLEGKIRAAGPRRRLLAVSDAVFSMDGDVLDLPRVLDVCERHGAFSMIDEAHATGVVGETGRGLAERFACRHADVTAGTLSKALGAEGGFVCASALLVDYLVNRSRQFIFSTAMSPDQAAAAEASLARLEACPQLVRRLRENVAAFTRALEENGIRARTESAIVPILVGDEKLAVEASRRLAAEGVTVHAIRYPTVPRGEARLRVAVSAAHDPRSLARAAALIAEAVRAVGRA